MNLNPGLFGKGPPRPLMGAGPNEGTAMDARETSKTLTERELAQILQRYFARFVTSAHIERDENGEPVVRVEFAQARRLASEIF